MLAVSNDDLSEGQRLIQFLGIQFPVLYDVQHQVISQWGLYNHFSDERARPSTFIIDKQGNIRYRYLATTDVYDRPETDAVLHELRKLQ